MVNPTGGNELTSEDWDVIVIAVKMIEALDGDSFRKEVQLLARELERQGLRAHRCTDRLEKRSAVTRLFTPDLQPSEFTHEAVMAKLSPDFAARHWSIADGCLHRLDDFGLDDPNQLRQQAATLLDASQILDEMLIWYELRVAVVHPSKRGSLLNDTIATIMIDWDVTPATTARHLKAHGLPVNADSLKSALARQRARAPAREGEAGPLSVVLRSFRPPPNRMGPVVERPNR